MEPSLKETNPFKPGAGHPPPFLAGREEEIEQFRAHLKQDEVLKNLILTGLRGTGKTVLMDSKYKEDAQKEGWVWVGSDFSESSFLTETNLCVRLLTDLSVFSSTLSVRAADDSIGFQTPKPTQSLVKLEYEALEGIFSSQPGLTVDKLKTTLDVVWRAAKSRNVKGIVFAYDESQLVCDRKEKDQYPLAVLLEAFQSLQKRGARYLLLLTGLPTLFARLVESRTYAERMFTVQELGRLEGRDAKRAITVPVEDRQWKFTEAGVQKIIDVSDGYPYFIQYFCRETFDHLKSNPKDTSIPIDAIMRKLDSDFFAGRWESLTDRMRDFLYCVAALKSDDSEFTISEVVEASKQGEMKAFSRGDVSQMLPRLIERGLVYKNRHGRYAFAVPLFGRFIQRKREATPHQQLLFTP